ncbi:hypothetical protein KIN20_006298, partial [Parelaphostrongylus tenuis]
MSTGQDEAIVRHDADEENLAAIDRPTRSGSSTNLQEDDGNTRDSGIVADYLSPLKVVNPPSKVAVLTDKTNTYTHPEESFPSLSTNIPIDETPVTSRRRPSLWLSDPNSDDDEAEASSVVSLPSLESVVSTNIRAISSSSTSSFSSSEGVIVWTPEKVTVVHRRRSISEERTAPTLKSHRKRSTESVMSESGIARKRRSHAIRCDSIQSEINVLEEGFLEADDNSPNASYLSECGLSSIFHVLSHVHGAMASWRSA